MTSQRMDSFFSEKEKKTSGDKWSVKSKKWKDLAELIAKWITKNSRPISIVEDDGLIEFLNVLCPEFQVPGHSTIMRIIDKLYEEQTAKLKSQVDQIEHCTLTTDGGSASNASAFVDCNIHWIDEDWEMGHKVIGVQEMKETHSAANYKERVDNMLDDFWGERENLSGIGATLAIEVRKGAGDTLVR